ncbi:MAG TPA: 2-succinyl-5-enolpyruvyl-6-hydroxy-3-cyclohexene-1-carboxylic-acid synthase [Mycobacteriales bacterium]|nr:2-succinyl-5-enolpyruvyl-6-hydroxy-3-cyclohexene-1-carboxylic-acid synthase [Mycobacteriales bacterium]
MPAENAGRAFSVVLVDELARQGVRHAVIAPGSRSTPIALALLENRHIAVHVRIDERSAAYLALGIAKASGSIVPVLCTSGTATSYFHGAVMEADLSCVPLLALTADRPPELHGIGANQTVEQRGLYGSAVRWAPVIETPAAHPDSVEAWRTLVAEAAVRCQGLALHPPGPVHLNLPLREPLTPTDDGIGFPYDLGLGAEPQPAAAQERTTDSTAELQARLAGVRRGIVVLGDLGGRPATPALAFAERLRWPIIAEPHSRGRHGPMALRSTDGLLRDEAFTSEHRPDLVVVVRRVGLSRALLDWLSTVPHIVVSPDGGRWDPTRSAAAVIDCPLEALADVAVEPADPSWSAAWRDASNRVSAAIDAVLDSSAALTEPQVARDVSALVPAGTALVVSSSMPIRDLDLVMQPRSDIAIYANRGVSGIDGFVSTAQGIALGRDPAGPTVALCGDLSLLHDINGLLPGPDARPDVTYVVINNDGGGIFSLLPQGSLVNPAAFERLFGTPHGISVDRLAAAYDVDYKLVATTDELAEALSTYDGVRIIEVRTDRRENTELHARLRAVTARTA